MTDSTEAQFTVLKLLMQHLPQCTFSAHDDSETPHRLPAESAFVIKTGRSLQDAFAASADEDDVVMMFAALRSVAARDAQAIIFSKLGRVSRETRELAKQAMSPNVRDVVHAKAVAVAKVAHKALNLEVLDADVLDLESTAVRTAISRLCGLNLPPSADSKRAADQAYDAEAWRDFGKTTVKLLRNPPPDGSELAALRHEAGAAYHLGTGVCQSVPPGGLALLIEEAMSSPSIANEVQRKYRRILLLKALSDNA